VTQLNSARKAITLIVKVAYAGGHFILIVILVVLTVSNSKCIGEICDLNLV
jgi:hypothetical protein